MENKDNEPTITLNVEQRLFSIKTGGGYTRRGWDNVLRDSLQIYARLLKAGKIVPAPSKDELGTLAGYAEYQKLLVYFAETPKAHRDTWYDNRTPAKVRRILEDARDSDRILRLFYGDPETGRDWCEENDLVGYIGRSCGTMKIPLLLEPIRDRFSSGIVSASGGCGIMDSSIIRIADVSTNEELYRHAKYQLPQITLTECEAALKPQGCQYAAMRDGENVANFKSYEDAARYLAFMLGASFVQFPYRTRAEYEADFADAA